MTMAPSSPTPVPRAEGSRHFDVVLVGAGAANFNVAGPAALGGTTNLIGPNANLTAASLSLSGTLNTTVTAAGLGGVGSLFELNVAMPVMIDAMLESTKLIANVSHVFVDKLIEERIDDGQFDECDLTFAEMSRVRDSIVEALVGIYHPRIAYPAADREGRAAPAELAGHVQLTVQGVA